MSLEIPTGWEPPHKIVGSENSFELFAISLYDEIVAMLCAKSGNFNPPITADADRYTQEEDRIIASMMQQGVYFHGPEGSVFMDYKIMRKIAAQQVGWENIESQFSPEMSIEAAMQLARSIVANWHWAQE